MTTRDYSLLGDTGCAAVERGLASAAWYRTPLPRRRMKESMQRSDSRAIRDTTIYLGLLVGLGSVSSPGQFTSTSIAADSRIQLEGTS